MMRKKRGYQNINQRTIDDHFFIYISFLGIALEILLFFQSFIRSIGGIAPCPSLLGYITNTYINKHNCSFIVLHTLLFVLYSL